MADMAAVDEKLSPSQHDDLQQAGNGADARGTKRNRMSAEDDDDDDDKPGRERRKIEIKFIQDKSRRHITFSKRKAGIMKKVRASRRDTQPLLLPTFTSPSSMLPFFIWETFRRAGSRSDSVASK
jgi:hypothetical protein